MMHYFFNAFFILHFCFLTVEAMFSGEKKFEILVS